MIFRQTAVAGAVIVELEPREDDRGNFARSFCAEEFAAHGLEAGFVQQNLSFSRRRGTLRGLHWQVEPHGEAKLTRCVAGALFDVAVDVRPGSPTFGRWAGVELTAANRLALYVPRGCAHGYLTLADATEALYQASGAYAPDAERGLRWNDLDVAIAWPIQPTSVSQKDSALPRLAELAALSTTRSGGIA